MVYRKEEFVRAYTIFLLSMVESESLYWDKKTSIPISVLYNTKYLPRIKNDKNRVYDALQMREQFFNLFSTPSMNLSDVVEMDVNLLEVFVALAVRAGETIVSSSSHLSASGEVFQDMFYNMPFHGETLEHAQRIADMYANGRTDYGGFGGPFPIKNPKADQRKIELWYQMMTYFGEHYDITGKQHV